MMRLIHPALLAASLSFAPFASADEWESLLEGATVGDFYVDFIEPTEPEEVFEIDEDGTLHIEADDKPEGYIQTLDEYDDYELEFEWRWPKEPGDSGLLLHCSDARYTGIWPRSIAVELQHENVGDIWLIGEKAKPEKEEQYSEKGSERDRIVRLENHADRKSKEWNKMKVVVKVDAIAVHVNDKLVNKVAKVSADSGFIAFQAEESDLEIRNLRIKEL